MGGGCLREVEMGLGLFVWLKAWDLFVGVSGMGRARGREVGTEGTEMGYERIESLCHAIFML